MLIPNLAIAGYRSFGEEIQYFDRFVKINIFIGRNNAGKSNVLRMLEKIYPRSSQPSSYLFDPLDAHFPSKPQLRIGRGEILECADDGALLIRADHPILQHVAIHHQDRVRRLLGKVFAEKRRTEKTNLCWSVVALPNRDDQIENWEKAFGVLPDHELKDLWAAVTIYRSGGNRNNDWIPGILAKLRPDFDQIDIVVIPAIRQIGEKGSVSDGFDGNGIIERLAKLQNPGPHHQEDRKKFHQVRNFLRSVVDDETVEIEVPYERDTLVVHMEGKALPIQSLGSGIHEVVILAAAATVLTNCVVCIEEPELHLNPVLQKKLMRYLSQYTSNQYFITTHSAALMDLPEIEIYHLYLERGATKVTRVFSDISKSGVCDDLGYHASDLLQANCVIWVEGPSDRLYLNFWILGLSCDLVEGVHYSIMFYGGRLASHLTYTDELQAVDDFISLRRLNRRGVMLFDSDKDSPYGRINETKQRLRAEFDKGPGHAWVTDGREIENYLPVEQVKAAIGVVAPRSAPTSTFTKYENLLKVRSKRGKETQASKIEVARYITENYAPDYSIHNLDVEVRKVIRFIAESNPKKLS
jgi:energy-coupling factor transporter ATP-binding protein EcfA2